jgi:acyl-CoA dehydrogenase
MNLSLDPALRERLERLKQLGRTRIRPAGLEADRAGAPLPPEHPFFGELVRLGLGRTRWLGGEAPEPGDGAATTGPGPSLLGVILSEELAYWDRGVAVAFPGPASASRRCSRWGPRSSRSGCSARFATPTGRAGARSR